MFEHSKSERDALVPKCRGENEGCRCHPSYSNYNEKSTVTISNLTDNCLKLFTKKLNWNSAYSICERDYSFILQKEVHSSLYEDLKNRGIQLTWTGIKRNHGFDINLGSAEPSFFQETGLKKELSLKNPVFDCVALNLSHGELVTMNCSTKLEFVCQNSGFPIYLAEENLEVKCPVGFHKLDTNLCFLKNTESHRHDEANEICQNSSSYLMNLRIFMKFFYTDLVIFKRFWISEKVASPNVMLSILQPISVTNSSLSTSSFHCASVSSSFTSDLILMESCQKQNSFICIYQPLKVLKLRKLTNSWSRLSNQKACYNFQKEKNATWKEASDICRSSGSSLLQSIRHPTDYALFKVLFYSYVQSENRTISWWMNLKQDNDSVKWLTSPPEELQFLDWNAYTDYSRQGSAGVLAFDTHTGSLKWDLKNSLDAAGFICEMTDCTDNHPTLVYIEDRTNKRIEVNNFITALQNLKLHCVPSGWFVADSLSWYKDGIPILSNSEDLLMFVAPTAKLEDILPYQGYYWCSADKYQPFERKYSSKFLFRLPGLRTFVLYLLSPNLFVDVRGCSDFLKNFMLPPAFVDDLNKTIDGFEIAVLRNITCDRYSVHFYIHIHIQEDKKEEEQVLKSVEKSIFTSIEFLRSLVNDLQINKTNSSLRSSVFCQKEKVLINNFCTTWPTTLMGQRAQSEEMCVGGKGNAIERECLGDFNIGAFWGPIKEKCVHVHSNYTLKLYKLSRKRITEDNVLNASLNLEALTTSSEDISLIDVQYFAQILRNLAKVTKIEPKTFTYVANSMDKVIGALERLKIDSRYSSTNVSSKMIYSWGNILSKLDTEGDVFKAAGSNIVLFLMPLRSNSTRYPVGGVLERWNHNQTTLFNGTAKKRYEDFNDFEAKILLPENLVAHRKVGENLKICIHKNLHNVTKVEVVSPVIDVLVGRRVAYDLDPPVEMVFKVNEIRKNASYDCAYWDQHLNNDFGGWSYKGCISKLIDSSHVQCFCDHLTSFAVILTMTPDFEVPEYDQKILASITYIGCAFSIFGLGIVILTFILFRQWRSDVKHKALFHLSLALFFFLLIFMVGVERREGGGRGCMVVATLLHFFMLASFAWMLVEAFMQYLSLVKVIGTYIPRFMQKAVLFGWGVPAVIVGTTLGYNHQLYDSESQYCLLSKEVFYYAVAGPVLTMLLLNFFIFALILYFNTCGRPLKPPRSNQNERQENVTRAKAVFCISILLGLSWIFAFLAVDKATLVFQYLFSITTTLQGFFIFVFFMFCQKKTRDLWLGLFTRTPKPDISDNTLATDVTGRRVSDDQKSVWSQAVFRVRTSIVSFNESLWS